MSFSPFEVLMGLVDTDSDVSVSYARGLEEANNNSRDSDSSYDLPSHDNESVQSLNDTMSLNSETLQDFGSIVSLPPGTLAALFRSQIDSEDGEHTIVSSAPSGAYIPPPEASQDAWAISPHPNFVPDQVHSIPTVCTDTISYQDLLEEDVASQVSSLDENHTPASTNALVRAPMSRQSSSTSNGHDPVAFMAIANHLLRESTGNGGNWYAKFTEHDWEQFQKTAKEVLSTLDLAPSPAPLPLPPLPPVPSHIENHVNPLITACPYSAQDILPSNFVCPLCKDVIVGALTLDCGCASSVICSPCWETSTQGQHHEMSDELGYVWVDQRKDCPSCRGNVNSNVPCHALDVAILQIVQNLSSQDPKAESLKRNYYSRLEAWRTTVLERNIAKSQKQTMEHDEILARLIQEEENVLWERHQCREKALSDTTRNLLFLGQAAVALLAATIASVGFGSLARRYVSPRS